MLAELGHDVVEAGTGQEALARLLHGVDLMVCDIGLPDVDGLLLVDQVRARLPGLPVVIATGTAASGNDAVVWLSKPYDEIGLRAALTEALAVHAEPSR